MKIRVAEIPDIEPMVHLSDAFRTSLAAYSPVFWRKAADSFEKQVAWFRSVLPHADTLAFVAEVGSDVQGFAIGRLQAAPPVYAPGGTVCLIDDFCVESDSEWSSLGLALVEAVEGAARARGAVLSVAVCPRLAEAKRKALAANGFDATTEWYVRNL